MIKLLEKLKFSWKLYLCRNWSNSLVVGPFHKYKYTTKFYDDGEHYQNLGQCSICGQEWRSGVYWNLNYKPKRKSVARFRHEDAPLEVY